MKKKNKFKIDEKAVRNSGQEKPVERVQAEVKKKGLGKIVFKAKPVDVGVAKMPEKTGAVVKKPEKDQTLSINGGPLPEAQQEAQLEIKGIKDIFKLFKANLILFFLIIIFSFAVYYKVIRGEFLNIDDLAGIVQNPTIRDLNTAIKSGFYHQIYYAVIFKFFGLNSTAFHVASIILHIVNSVLVFLFVYTLFGKKIAVITTALFTVNPTGSEAINWLSASGYLDQTGFYIVIIMLFVLYRRSKDTWYIIASAGLFELYLLVYRSSWALVVPFLIIIIDLLLLNDNFKIKNILKKSLAYLPFIVFSIIFVLTQVLSAFQNRAYTLETQHYLNVKNATPYLNRIPYSIFMIGRQYVYPERLTIYHEGRIIGNTEYTIMIISSILFIILCLYLLKKNRSYAALLLSIPTATLPSFSPVAIAWLVADRYLYFGAIFFCVLVAKILLDLEHKVKLRNASTVFGIILFIVYFVRTFVRADDFSTSEKLWLATMKAAPLSYRVYNNLGDVYANQGKYELAIKNFEHSLELKPDYADAVHNLGYTYMQMADYNKARYYLQKSFEMNPRLYQSLFKLGYIEMQLGNFEGAKYYLQKTLEINPGNPEAIQLLNNIAAYENQIKLQTPAGSAATISPSSQ